MNLTDRIKSRTYLDLNKREFVFLFFLLLFIGTIFTITPFYSLIALTGLTILTIGLINPKQLFLATGIFLIFQMAIVRNLYLLGFPEKVTNIINRIDEFIWMLFIIYILIRNYKGNTWQFKKTNLDSIAVIFIFIGFISAFFNHNSIFWSSVAIFIALKGFFIYWIAKNMTIEKTKFILFFKIFIYILVFAALIGILQFFGMKIFIIGTGERFGVKAAQSIFGHHGYGSLLAIGIALCIGLKMCTGENKWLFLSTILLWGLIASTVRRSLVGLLLGIIFIFLKNKNFKIPKKYIYHFTPIFIIFFVLFSTRLSKTVESTKFEYGISTAPAARYWLYYGAYRIIKNKPLFGEGPGKYGSYISVIKKSEIYGKYNIIVDESFKLDTYWASILGEYGILGFLTIISLLVIIFNSLLKGYNKENNTPFISGLYIGYIIIFIDFIVESIASPVYTSSLPAFICFAGIGLITGYKENS